MARTDRPLIALLAVPIIAVAFAILPETLAGDLTISVSDQASGEPVAARMHLRDELGEPVRARDGIFYHDHFVFDGNITLELKPGRYEFELERGPEYKLQTGSFQIEQQAKDKQAFVLERFVDMKSEGWWSGETHIHRPIEEIETLMRAEDLHVGPVITWWNKTNLWSKRPIPDQLLVRFDSNRFYRVMSGEDEREGGALLYFQLDHPLPITQATREFPSPATYLALARQDPRVHVDIEKPFWWDMPTWIATGQVQSIGLANNHMQRSEMLDNEAWGRPRDQQEFPSPLGNGRWTEFIYYQLLEAGIRIPPSAGSASGVLRNPVGYNRVYVHCNGELTWDKWWEGLRHGQVVVTNGPLLRPRVNGQWPGHVFTAPAGESVELRMDLQLALRDPVDHLEVIKNGQVEHRVPLADYANAGGQLPTVKFDQSGWMLVRAVSSNAKTFRFASTGPYYVEIGGEPRISRRAAQFFLDWVDERLGRLKLQDPGQLEEVAGYHRAAREFWERRVRDGS